VQTLQGDIPVIDNAEFSRDSSLVVMVTHRDAPSTEFTTGIWLIETGQCMQIVEAGSWHRLAIFSPNGRLVATSSENNVSLWNTGDWRRMQKFGLGNTPVILPVNMKFSPDSAFLASLREDMLEVWHCDSGKCMLKSNHQGYDMGCAFSSDSKFIAINLNFENRDDDQIQLWSMETSQHLHSIRLGATPRPGSGITHGELIRFTPDDSGLETSRGVIALSNFPPTHWNHGPVSFSFSGCGISPDRVWITWDGDRVLRLPAQYRPWCSAVSLDTVVLGRDSGRVTILRRR
jgi:WD40 repeat protein